MATPFLGEIKIVSFNFAPQGWALCNGQLLPINQNQALFALFGTMYGGNGQTNFALPDLRSRVPIHVGNGHTQGERAGAETHTVNIAELPTHTHAFGATTSSDGRSGNPKDRIPANSSPNNFYGPPVALVSMKPGLVENIGGSQPHINMQPYLVLNFIVAMQGIFPSRN
ncbi:MAG TPA: tail fiber protein [Cyclobacteriaceae bacterium]|nr:tail fiber protein [Cyclobacteriaceae bacterium]